MKGHDREEMKERERIEGERKWKKMRTAEEIRGKRKGNQREKSGRREVTTGKDQGKKDVDGDAKGRTR